MGIIRYNLIIFKNNENVSSQLPQAIKTSINCYKMNKVGNKGYIVGLFYYYFRQL